MMVLAVATILVALMLVAWAWQNGQINDMDEARHIALKERQPEPWPGREHDC